MHTKDVKKCPPPPCFCYSEACATMLIVPLVIIASMLFNGFVLMKLWEWFFVPFAPVKELSLAAAVGMFILVGLVVGNIGMEWNDDDKKDTPVNNFLKKVLMTDLKSLACLISGWIFSFFV